MTQQQYKQCPHCGATLPIHLGVCGSCGFDFRYGNSPRQYPPPGQYPPQFRQPPVQGYYNQYSGPYVEEKNKIIAAMLAFFLGAFGAHGFYLGNNSMALTFLLITLLGGPLCFILIISVVGILLLPFLFLIGSAMSIVLLIQTILYLCATDADFHQKYVVEKRWF